MAWTELTQHPSFPLWVLLAGLLLVVLLAFLMWRKIRFFRNSQLAIAQAVSFDKRSAFEGNVWHTTVEFTDAQQTKHRLEYTGSGPYPPFAKGGNLKVYYDPRNPQKAYAYTFWKVWVMELVIGSIALLLIMIGAGNL